MSVSSSGAAERLTVYTVNYPLEYFAQRIAGEHAEVVFPAPDNVDPAFWNPEAGTINEYQRADLIFLNGADYAKWVNKVSLPRSRLVDTSAMFKAQYLVADDGPTHSHGLEGEHSHGDVHFTTWLDLTLAVQHGEAVATALAAKLPAHQDDFLNNFDQLKEELLSIDQSLKSIGAAAASRPLLASHPIYQYFGRRYELNMQSVLWEPDRFPDENQWTELGHLVKNHPASMMIWEGPPLQKTIDRLESLGIDSVVFETCANGCSAGDFLAGMQTNVVNLKSALQ